MTNEEIEQMSQKEIADWLKRREGLDCPMVGRPCTKRKCRFYQPAVVERKDVPGGEPEYRTGYRCMYDLQYNDIHDLAAMARQGAAPKLFVPGASFPGLPPLRGPN